MDKMNAIHKTNGLIIRVIETKAKTFVGEVLSQGGTNWKLRTICHNWSKIDFFIIHDWKDYEKFKKLMTEFSRLI